MPKSNLSLPDDLRTFLAIGRPLEYAIAHQDFSASMVRAERPSLALAQVRVWRKACDGLARFQRGVAGSPASAHCPLARSSYYERPGSPLRTKVHCNLALPGDIQENMRSLSFPKGACVMNRIAWALFPILAFALGGGGATGTFAGEKPHDHGMVFDACAKACADCSNSCASCYHHCVGLVSAGKQDHAKTMILCNDCAEVCATAAKLTSRHSPFSGIVCETCAKTCDECGAACTKSSDDKHMTDCAKACKDCATACRAMIKHLGKS